MPARSRFADAAAAARALQQVRPLIEPMLSRPEISGLGVLHLVVLDPADEAQASVLHELSIGERSRWDVDYAAYAQAKARLSWRHRMDSRRLQLLAPHLLDSDEPLIWGGVWLDGIVVAASGAMPIWDEAFALAAAGQLRALAWARAEQARER